MRSSSYNMLIFAIALIVCCQAESFALNSRVLHVHIHAKSSVRTRGLPVAMHCDTLSRLRGGEVRSAAKSLFETVSSGTIARSLAAVLHSFVDPAITGGFLSGGLHAITGPDHLAALIAPTVGKSGFHGIQMGALWGVGHCFTAVLLGLCAFFLKGQFSGRFAMVEKLSTLAESVVGMSILVIGIMGIKESQEAMREENNLHGTHHHQHHHHGHCYCHSPSAANEALPLAVQGNSSDATISITANAVGIRSKKIKPAKKTHRAVFANGMLHGFSWDGASSLAPAITMATWQGALSFLAAYSLGTIVAMSLAAGAIGELSTRVGNASNNPDLPRKLSFVSSMAAVAIGLYLTTKSILRR